MKHLPPKYFTVHAAATYPSMDIGIEWIKRIHVNQNGWSDVGYHYFIRRDGTIEKGRPDYRVGAHVGANNTGNLGICMAGGLKEGTQEPEDNFTDAQYTSLTKLLTELHREYPDAEVRGHNEFPRYYNRGCPCFRIDLYRDYLYRAWADLPYLDSDWYDQSKYHWKAGFNESLDDVNLYKEMPQIHTTYDE